VKDDLIEPGDGDGVYKPAKSPKPKEGVSFDNPLYVAADNDDMQQLIGCEITELTNHGVHSKPTLVKTMC